MSTALLFVYGSLKRGFRHHGLIASLEFVSAARTVTGYRLVRQGEYPALVAGGSVAVLGELYRVPVGLWPELDRFEGCPDLYRRETILLSDGAAAFAYLIPVERARGAPELGEVWLE